eukprot:GFYU01005999.1.p1 GENE.GFYU01005999.1~~GFYU01005999.1.p1  ORF type:complete len:613 (-),score=157.74 GFYU01005999.1:784-2409(-)
MNFTANENALDRAFDVGYIEAYIRTESPFGFIPLLVGVLKNTVTRPLSEKVIRILLDKDDPNEPALIEVPKVPDRLVSEGAVPALMSLFDPYDDLALPAARILRELGREVESSRRIMVKQNLVQKFTQIIDMSRDNTLQRLATEIVSDCSSTEELTTDLMGIIPVFTKILSEIVPHPEFLPVPPVKGDKSKPGKKQNLNDSTMSAPSTPGGPAVYMPDLMSREAEAQEEYKKALEDGVNALATEADQLRDEDLELGFILYMMSNMAHTPQGVKGLVMHSAPKYLLYLLVQPRPAHLHVQAAFTVYRLIDVEIARKQMASNGLLEALLYALVKYQTNVEILEHVAAALMYIAEKVGRFHVKLTQMGIREILDTMRIPSGRESMKVKAYIDQIRFYLHMEPAPRKRGQSTVSAPTMSGDLEKKSPGLGGWQKRHFELIETELCYFKGKGDRQQLGAIDFFDVQSVASVPDQDGKHRFRFDVVLKDRTYHLAAHTMTDRDNWVVQCNQAMKKSQKLGRRSLRGPSTLSVSTDGGSLPRESTSSR